jgi:hypothetical protein
MSTATVSGMVRVTAGKVPGTFTHTLSNCWDAIASRFDPTAIAPLREQRGIGLVQAQFEPSAQGLITAGNRMRMS